VLTAETTHRRPTARVVGAFLLSPLVVRVMLIIENNVRIRAGDLRGITLDVAVSLLMVIVALSVLRSQRWGRPAASALVALWCLVNLANYEHIRELGAMARLAYAGFITDPTFLFGSGLSSSHPLVFSLVLVVSILALWISPRHPQIGAPLRWLLVAVVVFSAPVLIPLDQQLSEWRQTNIVAAQAHRLIDGISERSKPRMTLHRTVQADLSGESMINRGPQASNVLLVILEGVSGAYLPSLRDRHGAPTSITMPHLDGIAQSGLSWSTFINHQRQTNRGEYAILCGDYPKLAGGGEPKMTELVGAGPLDCLPAVLRNVGYATVYLQAAPMPFMLKDQFMPQAGFATAAGDTFFDHAYGRNHWGVDDLSFLETSIELVEQLQQNERPWFLTLLTVGTHHPFNAPDSFQSTYERGSDGWAMDYLDRAVGFFIQELEELGVLDDTLVLITSDESREAKPHESDEVSMLSQSWGFLIVLTPSGETGIVDEPFMQLDLPISILDYLDVPDPAGRLVGRSVFRRYDTNRDLLWGNTYLDMAAGLSSSGDLVLCDGAFRTCRGAELAGPSLYSPDIELSSVDPSTVGWLRRGVEESRSAGVATVGDREYLFIPPGSTPVMEDASGQLVFGGQFLTIPASARADVEIEIELAGPVGGALNFSHDVVINDQQQYLRTGRLEVGQTVTIRYTMVTRTAHEGVHFRFWVEGYNTTGLKVMTKNARITLSPVDTDALPPGLTEHEFQISGIAE
jgi:Sulfatase